MAKQHLLEDIVDILERLGKADNIPFNQLYYITKNCADWYYTTVIKTFTTILKRQVADHQTLLVNTARSLKFLEEYTDRQVKLWKVIQNYTNIPDEVTDIHTHFEQFKASLHTKFKYLKQVIAKNTHNLYTNLTLQQAYTSTLGAHVKKIYIPG